MESSRNHSQTMNLQLTVYQHEGELFLYCSVLQEYTEEAFFHQCVFFALFIYLLPFCYFLFSL